MTEYLVGVEQPCYCDKPRVVVTDYTEGFGPGLLADHVIEEIEATSPPAAGYCYAKRQGLTNILIEINVLSNSEFWWMHSIEAHKIDTSVPPIGGKRILRLVGFRSRKM